MDISKFKDIFIREAEDHLQKLNDNLLVVERTVKQLEKDVALSDLRQQEFSKLLDELMRSAHTLKSSSATMGYAKMAFFTHILEDVFDHARNGILTITSSIINEMFPAFDKLNQSLD